MWRIADPKFNGTYYHHESGTFVSERYTTWTNKEKLKRFGQVDSSRNWESFGYPIRLYDNDDETNPAG